MGRGLLSELKEGTRVIYSFIHTHSLKNPLCAWTYEYQLIIERPFLPIQNLAFHWEGIKETAIGNFHNVH